MSATRFMVFATVAMGVACCGCERLNVSLNYHEPSPVVYTHVDVGHVCTDGCLDHYYDGSKVIVLRGHRHGYGCGHRWDGHYWRVAATRSRARVVHVCDRHCHNHYWNGSNLVTLGARHRHNDHCGHHWDGHHWVVVSRRRHRDNVYVDVAPPAYVPTTHHHGPACGCVFDRAGSKWLKVKAGHIHGAGCGHVLQNGRWSVIVKSPNYKSHGKIRPRRVKRGH